MGKVVGRPFPKGVSGNPGGRPKGSLSKRLVEAGQKASATRKGMTREEAIAERVVQDAENGEIDAIKFYAERTEGKVAETLNLQGEVSAFPGVSDAQLLARVSAADSQQRNVSRKAGNRKENLH